MLILVGFELFVLLLGTIKYKNKKMAVVLEQMVEELLVEESILITPNELKEEIVLSAGARENVLNGRRDIANVLNGEDDRLIVITGPCSIDNYDAAIEYAERLKGLSEKYGDKMIFVMRVYAEKPRTTVGWKGLLYDPSCDTEKKVNLCLKAEDELCSSFDSVSSNPIVKSQGFADESCDIEEGLKVTRKLMLEINEMGVPVAVEFLHPEVPNYIGDLVSWAAIGARTSESQIHREFVSGLGMPVGFKNGTSGNVDVAVDAVVSARSEHSYLGINGDGRIVGVRSKGNNDVHVILRGGSKGSNYDSKSVEEVVGKLRDVRVSSGVIVDCSHANSGKDYSKQPDVFRAVIDNDDVVGVMLESYLVDGNGDEYGQSKTDGCMGWEMTEEVVREVYDGMVVGMDKGDCE